MLLLLLLLPLLAAAQPPPPDWSQLTPLLLRHISTHAFPGAVAAVASASRVYYLQAVGNFTYVLPPPATPDRTPPMQLQSLFDIASLTKV